MITLCACGALAETTVFDLVGAEHSVCYDCAVDLVAVGWWCEEDLADLDDEDDDDEDDEEEGDS